jgi:hypothetical protein
MTGYGEESGFPERGRNPSFLFVPPLSGCRLQLEIAETGVFATCHDL